VSTKDQLRRVILFGSNLEVEDVLLQQGSYVDVYDDDHTTLALSGQPCCNWNEAFNMIRYNVDKHYTVLCGVCSTPKKRKSAVKRIISQLNGCANWAWGMVESAKACVSPDLVWTQGNMVLDLAYVGPRVKLEPFSVILPGGKVYHECTLGKYSIIVGGATVLGKARIEDMSRVCGNATILPLGKVGPGATVGAGTTVKRLCLEDGDDT